MQLASFALVCVVAVQVASAHPAAGAHAGERSTSEIHEEFNRVGTQLQADLKAARARPDFRGDSHVQAVLNSVEEADRIVAQMEKGVSDPKHPMSQSELQRLLNDLQNSGKKIGSEKKLMRPEQIQDSLIRQILLNLGKRSLLCAEIALKQVPNLAQQFSGVRAALTF